MKKTLTLTLIIGLFVMGFYFYFNRIGRLTPSVNETFISSPHIPVAFDGVRIVQISDLLIRRESCVTLLENTVEAVNRLEPEIIVFTGNLFLPEGLEFEAEVSELLSSFDASLARIAVFGYYDTGDLEHFQRVQETFEAAGFINLINERIEIFNQAPEGINFIGATADMSRTSLDALLDAYMHEDRFNLLLLSTPTFTGTSVMRGVDFQLSGHCLGTRASADNQASPCFQFYRGIYQFSDQITLNVSTGLARFHTTSGFRQQPSIDSFLLIREE